MKRSLYLVLAGFLPLGAHAEIDEVYSPLVTKDQLEVEYKAARLGDSSKTLNNSQAHEVEMNYGVTDNFQFGVIGQAQRTSGDSFHATGYGVQGLYTTTHQGNWWLNSGVLGEYVAATQDDTSPDSIEGRLLLSRVQGPVTVNANLIVGREIGPNHGSSVGVGASAQGLYDIKNEYFTPGIEWYGNFGQLNHFSDGNQEQHYVGPIITGELAEFSSSDIGYTAGYYWGLTGSSANNGARIAIDYELHF